MSDDETKPPAPIEEPEPFPEEGPPPEIAPSLEASAQPEVEPPPVFEAPEGPPEDAPVAAPPFAEQRPRPSKSPRPTLQESREALYREAGGFRLRLEPADLARLRELPGSKGRTDRELGEEFFEKQADRFAQSLAEDVAPPAEVRVVVDPYSRQAFLAIERTIRSILSF